MLRTLMFIYFLVAKMYIQFAKVFCHLLKKARVGSQRRYIGIFIILNLQLLLIFEDSCSDHRIVDVTVYILRK